MITKAARLWSYWRGTSIETGPVELPVRIKGTEFSRTQAAPRPVTDIDVTALWVVFSLLLWGLVMVYSSSIAISDNPKYASYSSHHFLSRHIFSIVLGLVVGILAFQIPMRVLERAAPWVFGIALMLLVLVLVPFIGKEINGARRWIPFGIMNFQPSELAKLGIVLYAASYMLRKMKVKEKFFTSVTPMVIAVGLAGILLLAEPDMGAFLVITTVAMGILFLGGVNSRMFFLIATVLLIAFGLMIATSEYRRERIFAYLDPWSKEHAIGKGYQLSHALIAIGRGELLGVGLGGSIEKLHWLPEAHTDFILAVLGEEFGFVGLVLVIGLYLWLTRRIMQIGRLAIAMDQIFAGLMAQGVGIWIGFQAFINMGVNLGALPTKGLTLPLMSYGGSAILMNLVALALVLRVDHENRQLQHGGRV